MRGLKKLVTLFVTIVMVLSVDIVPFGGTASAQAATSFVITSPAGNALVAAGHMDIKWNPASGSVKNYNVYVDGSLVTTTTSTQYDFYTTKVNYHTAWIEANLTNGQKSYTPTVKFGVTKKGLCVNDDMGRNLNPPAMKMGWYYNWGTAPFSSSTYPKYTNTEFVPMIWGTGNESSIAFVRSKKYKYVLAYNEPDMPLYDANGNFVGGSNVDVNTAVSHWSKFNGIGQYVGAPAPALCPAWDNGTWFRNFMNQIDAGTVDFIPLHCYYGQYSGAAAANTFLTEVVDGTYNMYHKPILITEFATSGWNYNNAGNRASVNEFLKAVIAGLNSRSYVERYSWFSFDINGNDGASALWYSNGVLTDLGNTYVTEGNPTTEYKTGNATNPYKPPANPPAKPNPTKVTKPKKVTIKSLKNLKKRKVKITLKRVKKAAGYQIRICDNRKFNGYWNKTIKKTTYTFKRLDKNTRYYFKVRAYVKDGKNKLYGPWSRVKKIKIKR